MAVSLKEIAMLYIALFGRAPEGEGLNYWYEQASQNNWDLAELAEAMYEAALQYPEYADLQKPFVLVTTIYENVLGKTYADDPEGINYWVEQIKSGIIPPGEVAKVIIETALNQYPDHPATKTLLNRAELGLKVAEKIEHFEGDFTLFQEVIKFVNDDPASIEEALAYLEGGESQEESEQFNAEEYLKEIGIEEIAKNLPVALGEVFFLWNVGESDYGIWKRYGGLYDTFAGYSSGLTKLEVEEFQDKGIVVIESEYVHDSSVSYGNLTGRVNYELFPLPDVPQVKAKVVDALSYNSSVADYYITFNEGFIAEIVGDNFSLLETNYYRDRYEGNLTLQFATGEIEVNDLTVRVKELAGVAKSLPQFFGKENIKLTGIVEINGREYQINVEGLTVKDCNYNESDDSLTPYSETIIFGKISLTDSNGHQIELEYQNVNPYTTEDNLVGVSIDGEFYNDFLI